MSTQEEQRWEKDRTAHARWEQRMRERAAARAQRFAARGLEPTDTYLTFDHLARDHGDRVSERALTFRKQAVGFPAAVGGTTGLLWVGPAGIEFSADGLVDGPQFPWADVVAVDVPEPNAVEERVSWPRILLLQELSLMLPPRELDTNVTVVLTRSRELTAIIPGSSRVNFAGFVDRFRDATAAAIDHVSGLERLAALHAGGKLTDQEFTAAKQRLLGP